MSSSPLRYAGISIATAFVVLGLKLTAWKVSGSVGLLSDALETLANIGGALMAFTMLRIALQPPDEAHAYGHGKAEYFSSGFEGMLIFAAAAMIAIEAVPRLTDPQPIESPGLGLGIAVLASLLNFGVAQLLLRAGRRLHSVSLIADGRHLMTDVWTTVGVLIGLGFVLLTGWLWLDAAIALLVAAHVLFEGFKLISEAAHGLMDSAWPADELAQLNSVLDRFRVDGQVDFHAIRTRRAAALRFADFHVLVPGEWTVQRGHDLIEQIEAALAEQFERLIVSTHLEPSEDPRSYEGGSMHHS